MQQLIFATEFKAADQGRVSGYASVWSERDRGGDAVAPQAFVEVKTNAKGRIPFLWQHESANPIGTAQVTQDSKGLAFDAQLVLEDPVARTALAHFKAGSVSGLSIGYEVLGGIGVGYELLKNGVRLLKKLRLWEVSAVSFPMLESARIQSVKSKPENIGELEAVLRSCGYSKGEVKRLLSRGWRGVSETDDPDELNEIAALLSKAAQDFQIR